MILCLDVGNTQIHGGVLEHDKIVLPFRKTSSTKSSSDEYGIFLRSALRENDIDPSMIRHIAICTVVPDVIYSLKNACLKYFDCNPFILKAGVKTGLKIKYRNPIEVGADRIANSIAAIDMFPDQNIIVTDFGTATTLCAVNKKKEYLGGAILPGIRMSMQALESNTAKLPSVEISQPQTVIGRSTIESIQSGLFFGQLKMVQGLIEKMIEEENWTQDEKPILIATGGFSALYDEMNVFDKKVSALALKGLYKALQLNS